MTELGCPDQYTVEARVRGGARVVGRLTDVQNVKWSRVLTGTSEASVVVVPRAAACQELLDRAEGWAYELAVWRGDEMVWCGPLIDKDDSGTDVTLTARDVTAWLPRRLVHDGYDTTLSDDGMDLAVVALRVLVDAFEPDDPDVIRHVSVVEAGVRINDRAVEAETVMADAELGDLVKLGLDWTVVGRRIVVFSNRRPLSRIPALGAAHFTGTLPVRVAGGDVVTRCVVQGGGVRGVAGGVHPVYGLLEKLDMQTAVGDDDDAAHAARAALYTPNMLVAGGDLGLTALAPVSIADLVPGVQCTVAGRGAAVTVATDMLLTKVAVEWTGSGEAVGVTFTEAHDRSGQVE
jgi:hypothetical protein